MVISPPARANNVLTLRILLALGVVVLHGQSHDPGNPLFFTYPFVPAFLVLSGAVVMPSLERSSSYLNFFARRFFRLYPALIAAFGLSALLLRVNWPDALLWYFTGGIKGTSAALLPSWSLIWEQLCYILMAILVPLGLFKRPQLVALVVFVLLYIWSTPQAQKLPSYGDESIHLAACFLIGNLIYSQKITAPQWVFLPLILMGFVSGVGQVLGPIGCTLWALSPHPLGAWIERKIGDVSYGIYIYHWPIFITFRNMHWHWAPTLAAVLASTFCVSFLSWRFLEKPLSDWAKKPRRQSSTESPAALDAPPAVS